MGKRILILNWRDIKNPTAGGAEVVTHENAKRWVKNGCSVTLFAAAFANCKHDEILDGVRIVRDGGRYSVYWKAYKFYQKFFKGNVDIVVDEINTLPFFTPLYVKERIIVLIHQLARQFWFSEVVFPFSLIGYLVESFYLKLYKHLNTLTVSNSTKQDLLQLGFKKVQIISEGIDFIPLTNIAKKEIVPTMIFVGRLAKTKLPHHAIEAFCYVKKTLPDAKLWVVGDGYMKRQLQSMSCEGVEFFGFVELDKKMELLSKAHVLIMPAIREGWGLVVTEANACGTPCIGYDVHGLRDSIKHNKTGILTKNKPVILGDEILKFFSNKKLIEKLTFNALDDSRQYTWDQSAQQSYKVLMVDDCKSKSCN